MNLNNLTSQQLRQAADLKERIASLQKQLAQLLGGATETMPASGLRRRTMPASAIAKIRAAQKKRWAKIRAAAAPSEKPAQKTSGRSKMSPAAKAKLSAKLKAIWAARKAAKK